MWLISDLVFQTVNYKSQYTIEIEKYKKAQDAEEVEEKLKVYKKSKKETGTK